MKKQILFAVLFTGIYSLHADIVRIINKTPFDIVVESIIIPSSVGKFTQNIQPGEIIKASTARDILDLPEWEKNKDSNKVLSEMLTLTNGNQKISLTLKQFRKRTWNSPHPLIPYIPYLNRATVEGAQRHISTVRNLTPFRAEGTHEEYTTQLDQGKLTISSSNGEMKNSRTGVITYTFSYAQTKW